MAHECPECGQWCHCGGDIDDCCNNFPADQNACTHCPIQDESDEMDEEGCLFPGECCMPGEHVKGECHTPDMIEDTANAAGQERTEAERDLYRAGFLAAMQWYGCDQDEIERLSVSISDDIESGMIDKDKGAEEHRQLKAMWNAITANAAVQELGHESPAAEGSLNQ